MKKENNWKPIDEKQKTMMLRDMFYLAEGFDKSAEVLAGKLNPIHGPAVTHLGILAFEIRLKAVGLASNGERSKSHTYKTLWDGLDARLREEILHSAMDRFSGYVNYDNMDALFGNIERAFTVGRYQYEINDNRSPDEARKAGSVWIKEHDGALGSADLALYPKEVEGLSFALRQWLEVHL